MEREPEMTRERHPLCDRERPFASDVADAIEQLLRRMGDGDAGPTLPVVLSRPDIVGKLIENASISIEDGEERYKRPSKLVRAALEERLTNCLSNSSVFQAGYKRYEARSGYPIVPVTSFFLKSFDNSVREYLDLMHDFEVRMSLPRRAKRMRGEDNTVLRDERGNDVVESGEIAGIVVFPANSKAKLLCAWQARIANMANGSLKNAVAMIERARPDAQSVENLKELVRPLAGGLSRALPRPRREEE